MKSFVFAFLLIVSATYALDIDLSIEKTFVTEPLYFHYNDTIREFSTEILNSGSLPYVSQFRVDVLKNGTVFTAWSERKIFMPGNSGFFQLYWVPEMAGNYTTRYRVYYSGEVNETLRSIMVKDIHAAEDVFNVTLVNVFDNFIILEVKSGVDAERAVVIPHDYSQGMWISQKTLSLKAGQAKKVLLSYSSPVQNQQIKITVASEDGKHVSTATLKLEEDKTLKEKILRAFFSLLDK